jgi:hypothetical protein
MADLVYPQTRGERPPDLEKRLQYTHALIRLAAEDAEADKILAEVRSLLKPQSVLREPELASRVMAMMAELPALAPTRLWESPPITTRGSSEINVLPRLARGRPANDLKGF